MIGLAIGIDYSLLMVTHYREHALQGPHRRARSRQQSVLPGCTISWSGLTVMIGLLGLLFSPILETRSVGIGGALVVCVSVLAALTLLPAALVLLGALYRALGDHSWPCAPRPHHRALVPAGQLDRAPSAADLDRIRRRGDRAGPAGAAGPQRLHQRALVPGARHGVAHRRRNADRYTQRQCRAAHLRHRARHRWSADTGCLAPGRADRLRTTAGARCPHRRRSPRRSRCSRDWARPSTRRCIRTSTRRCASTLPSAISFSAATGARHCSRSPRPTGWRSRRSSSSRMN